MLRIKAGVIRSATMVIPISRRTGIRGSLTMMSRLRMIHTDVSSNKYNQVYNTSASDLDRALDSFPRRHLGPSPKDVEQMLKVTGFSDLNSFVESVVPSSVLQKRALNLEAPSRGFSEQEMISHLEEIANKNQYRVKNLIGKGYYGTVLPPVILRNVLESPEWYTSYTPYQPEVSQGRLESLLNFQTVVSDLTGLPVANASLLDEGTAAAEAMLLSYHAHRGKKTKYAIGRKLHPQTKSVLYSRAKPLNIEIVEIDCENVEHSLKVLSDKSIAGAIVQYPATDGSILSGETLSQYAKILHQHKSLLSVASDLMALTLLKAPAEFGADIALGSSQRFGVPMGYGGPHAAFFAVADKWNRRIPGRIVGVSKDRLGKTALRLALQTREQHIKRDKATSNICTAQALLANVAANYCVYHGPEGLAKIAKRIYGMTAILAQAVEELSPHSVLNDTWFDTLTIALKNTTSKELSRRALEDFNMNLFTVNENTVSLSLDETTTKKDLLDLVQLFTESGSFTLPTEFPQFPSELCRTDPILTNEVFHLYHSETAMLRYLHRLQSRDLSLANSMIPLGSCTMKLNSTVEMMPITWPQFGNMHPFQPINQAKGYAELISSLEHDLCNITGFDAVSLQPNSGASGEYAGLRLIRAYLEDKGQKQRKICLIPVSAHGTNPASAAMCGMKVVPFNCLADGSLDLEDLQLKIDKHAEEIAAVMITYPSTYGLYEEGVKKAFEMVHAAGGQVYLDGANMNAQVGLTSPGDLGADVCHLNLHKTFAIPHGGGGPAGAPICVRSHLAPYLPRHSVVDMITQVGSEKSIESVSSGPYGNALVLPISYAYIKMMGREGLPYSSVLAMLNANYMRRRLQSHYQILFGGNHCAHEFIIDLREFKAKGVEAIDVAKRLQDYGFHAPTLAFPVPHTLMVEPTESENLQELDRFVDAMISIRSEIDSFIAGDPSGAILKNAPHSLEDLILAQDWETRGYSREQAAYPLPYLRHNKFWPVVTRLDDTYGDMHLMCTCPSVEDVAADS
ncbi:GCV2 (YMR189W) [Zygosaccharomyces parabailii]|uniref:Glycine cleavage system P protein n=1 Tax=Zygosaccharomyces bailii (strain CLIB 213 / ATCC 58445 / CBS 680 / BCRC 21525 / NBRC 1098 / NCYC 1416 / NRRL Y-2227) TaxID=1333698 RepID=A0A8J2X6X9_ZYGB2|nr:GCV2 (YMR189W) [Zygosaccharomyces parabailii]CDF88192.1 BN860_04390g1_1 [Zygosaccharomyces bailii CLIB 213]CDH14910.1 probable Glycine dehydrogenase [decarboxylating],mitochondrial [Zygosaccharomyces bailii ISA1307]